MGEAQGASTDYALVMEHEKRLDTQYRALRRKMYIFISISVSFFLCCLLTLVYYTHQSSTYKEPEVLPKTEKQYQVQNLTEMTKQRDTSFTRLTDVNFNPAVYYTLRNKVKTTFKGTDGYLPWKSSFQNLAPDNTGYFSFDEDSTSLVVHRTGTFKISLQITYRGIENCVGENTLRHEIHRYTDSYTGQILLLTYMETVNFTTQYWRKSLFSEGIFNLEKGDRLKVWSNSLAFIDTGEQLPQKTFFVAYPHFST